MTKNVLFAFRLYYDGQFFVGEKKFDQLVGMSN